MIIRLVKNKIHLLPFRRQKIVVLTPFHFDHFRLPFCCASSFLSNLYCPFYHDSLLICKPDHISFNCPFPITSQKIFYSSLVKNNIFIPLLSSSIFCNLNIFPSISKFLSSIYNLPV